MFSNKLNNDSAIFFGSSLDNLIPWFSKTFPSSEFAGAIPKTGLPEANIPSNFEGRQNFTEDNFWGIKWISAILSQSAISNMVGNHKILHYYILKVF